MHFVRGQQRRPTRLRERGTRTQKDHGERRGEKETRKGEKERNSRARRSDGEERVSTRTGEGSREPGVARQGLGQAVLDSAQLPRDRSVTSFCITRLIASLLPLGAAPTRSSLLRRRFPLLLAAPFPISRCHSTRRPCPSP